MDKKDKIIRGFVITYWINVIIILSLVMRPDIIIHLAHIIHLSGITAEELILMGILILS